MNKALFLDRDGTIIQDVSLTPQGEKSGAERFVREPGQVVLIEGVAKAVALARMAGFKIIVVTNQSAIARGWLTEEKLALVHARMHALLAETDPAARIDDLYYCPFHEDGVVEVYAKKSPNRKPDIGMILEARQKHAVDLSASFMIGDTFTDMLCADRAGLKKILVLTGFGKSAREECARLRLKPDLVAKDLLEAVKAVLR